MRCHLHLTIKKKKNNDKKALFGTEKCVGKIEIMGVVREECL